jgi:hypothetical protein
MRITTGHLTAREAADEFARTAFDPPRAVGTWRNRERGCHHHYADFQLVGGVRWYEVWLLFDYSGWNIEVAPVDTVPQTA